MRRALPSAIPPSLYRHFAVLTLAVTTALAMFADGESHDAQAARMARPEPAPVPKPAAFATPKAGAREQSAPRWWDVEPDFDRSFGRPMERILISGSSNVIPEIEVAAAIDMPADPLQPLTQSERQALLEKLRESAVEPSRQTE